MLYNVLGDGNDQHLCSIILLILIFVVLLVLLMVDLLTELTPMVKFSLEILIVMYLVSGVLFLYRIIKGPKIFDRVLAIDTLSYDLTVFMAMIAFYTGRHVLVACMIPIALWAYTLDIYISWYVIRVRRSDQHDY